MRNEVISKKILSLLIISTFFLLLPSFVFADTGLKLNYHFSEGTGITTADSSGNANTGTLSSSSMWATGKFGNGLSFDGISQYVNGGNGGSLDITGNISISAWIRPSALGSWQEIISKGDYNSGAGSFTYFLLMTNTNKVRFGINLGNAGDFVDSSTTLAAGNWYHVVATFNPVAGSVKIYINGVLDSSGSITDTPLSNSNPLFVGALNNGGSAINLFKGQIDEVRIYTRILNGTEVLNAYNYNVCSSGCEFDKIQSAVGNATSGNTINVASGTYNESQIVINAPLNVIGVGPSQSIIDGGDATLTTDGLVRIIAPGNVTFSGFTLQNAGGPAITGNPDGCGVGSDCGDNKTNVGVYTSGLSGVTYTISNNKIIGTDNINDQEDYGLYTYGGQESLIFTYNQITETGSNPILIEKHLGPTEVSYNNLDEGVYGTVVYFSFTYGGVNISSLQNVSYNTINLGTGGGNLIGDNYNGGGIVFRSSFLGGGNGTYSNIQITGNTINNIGVFRRGISLSNDAIGDGIAGKISNVLITGNTITGTNAVLSLGIKLIGLITNATVMNNNVTGVDKGFYGTTGPAGNYPVGINVYNNSFGNNLFGIYLDGVANSTVTQNTAFGNTLEGIQLNGSSVVIFNDTISNNIVYGNQRHGILLVGSSNNNTVTGNKIYNNTYAGIALWSPSSPFPTYNLMSLNYIIKGSAGTSYTAGDWGISNQWNASSSPSSGNFWSDFPSNAGYIASGVYDLPQGSAGAIDYHPIVPSIVYVDPSFNNTNAGGHTFGYDAFNKIQDGVNGVAANGLVNVSFAVYDEVVNISKPLALWGQGKPIIQPDSSTPLLDQGVRRAAIYFGSNNVNVTGFVIDGTASPVHYGIYGFNSSNSVIKNNVIFNLTNSIPGPVSDVAGVGIFFFGWGQGTYGAVIQNNTVYNCGRMCIWVGGMQSVAPYNFMISPNNVIQNSMVYNAWQGPTGDSGGAVQINTVKNSNVTGNIIYNTGLSQSGIYIAGSASDVTSISGNRVYNNYNDIQIWTNDPGSDFGTYSAGAPVVNNNFIYNSANYGLDVIDSNSSFKVNATYNCWGSNSPTQNGTPPASSSSNAVISPWTNCVSNVTATNQPYYVRQGLAEIININIADLYGVNYGGVLVNDSGVNYTANPLSRFPLNKILFRATIRATTPGIHTDQIFVTNVQGFNYTTSINFYVEPAAAPQAILRVNNTTATVSGGTSLQLNLTFDRIMDSKFKPSVTLRGTKGGMGSVSGAWLTGNTTWQGTFTIPTNVKAFPAGSYYLTAVSARDMTNNVMKPLYTFAFTKS